MLLTLILAQISAAQPTANPIAELCQGFTSSPTVQFTCLHKAVKAEAQYIAEYGQEPIRSCPGPIGGLFTTSAKAVRCYLEHLPKMPVPIRLNTVIGKMCMGLPQAKDVDRCFDYALHKHPHPRYPDILKKCVTRSFFENRYSCYQAELEALDGVACADCAKKEPLAD